MFRRLVIMMVVLLLALLRVSVKDIVSAQSSENPLPAQISGHVYNTITGVPVANAFVVLQSASQDITTTVRTATDGSYLIRGLIPGQYIVFAYSGGFVPREYGDNAASPCPNCQLLRAGQKLDGIDPRLIPDPRITAMQDRGQTVAPWISACRNCAVRFSPNGIFLALGTSQVSPSQTKLWLYHPALQRLVPVKLNMQGLASLPMPLDLAWADNDTLYIKYGESEPYVRLFKLTGLANTATKGLPDSFVAQKIVDVPSNIASALERTSDVQNHLYTVTIEITAGNTERLLAQRNDGTAKQYIADNVGNFLFDKSRSLVFYEKYGYGYPSGSIITYDLNTRKSRETFLPVGSVGLMDQIQEGSGSLVVYMVQGPCEMDTSFIETEIERMRSRASVPLDRPRHICFVRLH